MLYLPAVLHGIALLIALNVQTMQTPLAGAWLPFHLAGCIVAYRPEKERDTLWWAALAWLITITISCFILAPVLNGATSMWFLSAMPMMALTIRKEHLRAYLDCFMAVLILYATILILQMIFVVRFNAYEYYVPWRNSYAVSWPLIDPNNAACVLNFGLIPAFYMALRKPKWLIPLTILGLALFATASRMGALVAGLACAVLMVERYGVKALLLGTPFLALLPRLAGSMGSTINARMDMWTASLPLLWKAPLTGLGFGTFSYYYDQVRTEHLTGGWYAHNDYLQIAIENGFPALLVLCFLLITVAATTRRKNLVSFCVILMLTLQAMVEFQFYLPCISIIAGLALAYHRNMGPDLEPRNSRSSMV